MTVNTQGRPYLAVSAAAALLLAMSGCSSAKPAAAVKTPASSTPSTQGPDLVTDPTTDAAAPTTHPATPTVNASGTPDGGTITAAAVPAGPVGPAHACTLVTEAEAATALGADPGAGDETADLGASLCIYGQYPSMVTISISPNGMAGMAHLTAQSRNAAAVPGVGDAAFVVTVGPSTSLWFEKGDELVEVGVIASGGAARNVPGTVTLAKLVAGRL